MSKARIFISHSCKDIEIDDNLSFEDEKDLRLRRLKYAKIVRDEVARLLGEQCEVLLDQNLLDPGDRWPIKLLRWLGDCDAAVLLLSEDAIQSQWVLQEATVLTWRRRLRADFILIPVMLGGLTFDALIQAGFGPLQVDEIQAASVEGAVQFTRHEALTLAKKIAGRFKLLTACEESNNMQLWVENVAAILSKVDERILIHTCEPLHISAEDWAHFSDRATTVAHYLLRADLSQIRKVLEKIRVVLFASGSEAFAMLTENLLPMWVNPAAAAVLADHLETNLWHAYAINSDDRDTAEDYAQRAWCCPPWWNRRFMEFNEHFGEGQENEAMTALKQNLAIHFNLPPERSKRLEARIKGRPFFVALGDQLAQDQEMFKAMLKSIASDNALRRMTCIQLAGPDFSRAPADEPALVRLLPAISNNKEDQVWNDKAFILDLKGI